MPVPEAPTLDPHQNAGFVTHLYATLVYGQLVRFPPGPRPRVGRSSDPAGHRREVGAPDADDRDLPAAQGRALPSQAAGRRPGGHGGRRESASGSTATTRRRPSACSARRAWDAGSRRRSSTGRASPRPGAASSSSRRRISAGWHHRRAEAGGVRQVLDDDGAGQVRQDGDGAVRRRRDRGSIPSCTKTSSAPHRAIAAGSRTLSWTGCHCASGFREGLQADRWVLVGPPADARLVRAVGALAGAKNQSLTLRTLRATLLDGSGSVVR